MERDRAAVRDVVPAMVTLLVVQGSLILLDPHGEMTVWYLLWSFSPLAPALWLGWAQLRSLRRADEYQRVIQLESMAIGFGAVILLSLTGGLLDAARIGDPRTSLQVTFTGGVANNIGMVSVLNQELGFEVNVSEDSHFMGAVGAALFAMDRIVAGAARHWSQADLADRLDVSRQTINAIETGRYDPSLPLAFKISEVFENPIESLFFPTGNSAHQP